MKPHYLLIFLLTIVTGGCTPLAYQKQPEVWCIPEEVEEYEREGFDSWECHWDKEERIHDSIQQHKENEDTDVY